MAVNRTVANIRLTREDLSDYVYHFTKGQHAFQTLAQILNDKQIKDMGQKGVICFTEAPFPMLVNMFDVFRPYVNPMYAPYGVAIKKTVLFDLGGRPVIYGSSDELPLIDQKLQWRFEQYHPVTRDFSWLREWRVPLPAINLEPDDCFILTDTDSDLTLAWDHEDIIDIEPDPDVNRDGVTVYMVGTIARQFKGISIEKLKEIANPTNAAMADMLLSQSFTDMRYVNLGVWNQDNS